MSEATIKKYLQTAPVSELGEYLAVIAERMSAKKQAKKAYTAEQVILANEIDEAWADYQQNGGKSIDKVFAKYGV
jgi:hypothetical protein